MTISIGLHEWSQRAAAERASPLAGLSLEGADARGLAQQLTEAGMLEVKELREGLSIASTSYVGRVTLAGLVITVQPKIRDMPLVRLLHYAYGLRDLRLMSLVGYSHEQWAFQEILIAQLIEEASELVVRGLHRRYERERRMAPLVSKRNAFRARGMYYSAKLAQDHFALR